MTTQPGEDVYASLLLTDTYLPGALVLAHSLRDAGTTKKLAILVTEDSVSREVIDQLKNVYDYVIPVPRIENPHPANLDLMGRRDLRSAFTKINLWNQTQFRRIVYLDADVVAYRAPDELFDLPHPFAAAPDIGWPDIFNTGVMVLTPNPDDYNAMMDMAQRGQSFDGADQGLLNEYYKDKYHRLSFTYNVTPSAHYQYVPAYQHFQANINLVHFIGTDKPWVQGRQTTSTGSGPFDHMVGKWWAVYDRHYKTNDPSKPSPALVRYFVKGEFQPTMQYVVPVGEPSASWDAQRHPPPSNTRGEAVNLPHTYYAMSSDPAQFIPLERYPSPPKNAGYQAPNNPPADRPKTIFPWETYQSKPTRVFSQPGQSPPRPAKQAPSTPPPSSRPQTPRSRSVSSVSTAVEPQTPPSAKHKPWAPSGATYTRTPPATFPTRVSRPKSSDGWSSFPRTNAWDDVPEINRYIERRMPWYLRGGASIQTGGGGDDEDETPVPITHRRGSRITEFPSDRPSLPVTPAPVGRPRWQRSGWEDDWEEGEQHAHERLAGAEGVPAQTDWVCVHGIRWCPEDCLCDLANVLHYYKDPAERLRKLAQEQSEALIKRLGTEQQDTKEEGRKETPRAEAGLVSPVPVRPPTPGAQGDVVERITSGLSGLGLGLGLAPPTGLAPPESEVVPSSAASTTYYSAFSSPKLTETSSPTLVAAVPPSRIAASLAAVAAQQEKELQQRQGSLGIQEPSYRGPGAAFEKGEDVPKFETPALPTEEELDVLET